MEDAHEENGALDEDQEGALEIGLSSSAYARLAVRLTITPLWCERVSAVTVLELAWYNRHIMRTVTLIDDSQPSSG